MRQFRIHASQWAAPEGGLVQDPARSVMRVSPPRGETRTEQQVREHYLIERELADRLRSAPRSERRVLYSELYDELFRRVPHHPMLHEAGHAPQQSHIARQLKFLRGSLSRDSVFMEIGAGDCALAIQAASLVKQVYAIDVSEQISRRVAPPPNFKLILSD